MKPVGNEPDKYYCLACDPTKTNAKKLSGLYGPNGHLNGPKHIKNEKKYFESHP
jgi:hypothetical protein